jgi:hypothetical protein
MSKGGRAVERERERVEVVRSSGGQHLLALVGEPFLLALRDMNAN